jgi:serine/threonine protein kinase
MNIIHTDLKPDNILQVSSSGRGCALKVIDFGNAIECTDSAIQPYMDEFDLQSLWYRAPEVVLGVNISLAIDMWSVGCVLTELFFGRPLFVAQTREDLIESVGTN